MPEPEYHRHDCCELSTRTAMTFDASHFMCGVRSYSKLAYPYQRFPRCCPLIQTSLFLYTPSNCMKTFIPFCVGQSRKSFLSQPIPSGRYPPPALLTLSFAKGPSMLQSWGASILCQVKSS